MNDHNVDMHLLEIYLDDHWAGAGAGAALAHRLSRHNHATEWGSKLAWLASQVEQDQRTLNEIRTALGFDGGTLKRRAAQVGERLGRLKLNGRVLGYSPLSRLVEAEAMMTVVGAKHRLWGALGQSVAEYEPLTRFDFGQLAASAEKQLEILHMFHQDAAVGAFARPDEEDT